MNTKIMNIFENELNRLQRIDRKINSKYNFLELFIFLDLPNGFLISVNQIFIQFIIFVLFLLLLDHWWNLTKIQLIPKIYHFKNKTKKYEDNYKIYILDFLDWHIKFLNIIQINYLLTFCRGSWYKIILCKFPVWKDYYFYK